MKRMPTAILQTTKNSIRAARADCMDKYLPFKLNNNNCLCGNGYNRKLCLALLAMQYTETRHHHPPRRPISKKINQSFR